MITVGLFEAKAHLGQLAQSAAAGEVIVLTRRGRAVAEIRAPQQAESDATPGLLAIDALRQWRKKVRPGRFDIKELVDEGRRG
jgi:antitoxin (DNA-binding transcriptional repressor) of toxin-antitoxin stability system